jgi:hypothetical protein
MPGGAGMTSEKVLTIVTKVETQDTKKTTAGTYTTGAQ